MTLAGALLMIAPEYPPHNVGGGGVVVRSLARELSRRGYRVVVVAGYHESRGLLDKPWVQVDGGVHVVWLPLLPTPRFLPNLETYMPPNLPSAAALYRIVRSVSRGGRVIVHLHGYGHLLVDYAALLLMLHGKPYVLTVHGIPRSPTYLGGKLLRLVFALYAKLLGRRTLGGAAMVSAISRAIAKEAVVYGAAPGRVLVIPNGIEPGYAGGVGRGLFRRRFGIGPRERIILAIGRLHPRKGFQTLIRAMPSVLREVPEAFLVIIGEGPYRRVLEELARRLGLEERVIMPGYLDEAEKKEALADSDLVVIPSLIEPFGLVALEAMALGKPLVATKVDGLREILEPYDFLVDPGDPVELASKITQLLLDADTRERTRRFLLEKVRLYYWSSIAPLYESLYKTLPTA
ncbi:MAG: glycosyltransferase family 4 protein [Desulfurococcales archaeon]|nr:glycosyltransferase family 4 protein [Desulfurococcales archaeon]